MNESSITKNLTLVVSGQREGFALSIAAENIAREGAIDRGIVFRVGRIFDVATAVTLTHDNLGATASLNVKRNVWSVAFNEATSDHKRSATKRGKTNEIDIGPDLFSLIPYMAKVMGLIVKIQNESAARESVSVKRHDLVGQVNAAIAAADLTTAQALLAELATLTQPRERKAKDVPVTETQPA